MPTTSSSTAPMPGAISRSATVFTAASARGWPRCRLVSCSRKWRNGECASTLPGVPERVAACFVHGYKKLPVEISKY